MVLDGLFMVIHGFSWFLMPCSCLFMDVHDYLWFRGFPWLFHVFFYMASSLLFILYFMVYGGFSLLGRGCSFGNGFHTL